MLNIQEKLLQNFKEVYNNLNEKQKEAVDAIDGPVMVIAGPGTGKTQILGARVGKILLETDVQPNNILCLTYTDAGVVAMRKRLIQFIGAEAHNVKIFTFHAFCNEVIQENLSLFEKNKLDVISDIEKIKLIRELIDEFPKGHTLKRYRGDEYYEFDRLKNLFSTMKKEGWSAQQISDAIDRYLKDLPNRENFIYQKNGKDFKKGDVKVKDIAKEVDAMEKVRAAANEFDNYQKKISAMGRYDYEDMINWVIEAFETHPELLLSYQEKLQYILVDEYQDTSGTQNKIVELLINYWDVPNVFVVGDDDQSIFRFQGASVENMLAFVKKYHSSLKTIVLTTNYRSTQPILDCAKVLIENNNNRLINDIPGLSKDLVVGIDAYKELTAYPEVREYDSPHEEMMHITLEVKRLLDSGVAPGNIAVLYRKNEFGRQLAGYLANKNIPFYLKNSPDLLTHTLIKKVLLILKYLNEETIQPFSGDRYLFEMMHLDFYNIPSIEIAKISIESANRKGLPKSMRIILSEKAQKAKETMFPVDVHQSLPVFYDMLESLIAKVGNVSFQELIQEVLFNGGVIKHVMNGPDKIGDLHLLTGFFDFIKEETARNPFMQLSDFIQLIDLMKKEGVRIPLTTITGAESSVNLLTAHGSKGLEFEHVFFAGLNKDQWELSKGGSSSFNLPDTIFTDTSNADKEEDTRRLFYVAITRAETNLYLSYVRYDNKLKERERTKLLSEITTMLPIPEEKPQIPEEERSAFMLNQLIPFVPDVAKMEEDFVNRALEKFKLSVTSLNNYLRCPLSFYYNNILRIPAAKSESMSFGTAVHNSLQKLFSYMLESPERKFPPKEVLVSEFKLDMEKRRECFSTESFKRRLEYGEEILKSYYDKYMDTWEKIVSVERNIAVTFDNVLLKGKLDKLEFNGNKVNVVDYKTGKYANAMKKLKGPDSKDPNGGDYWRQAVFYKLLVDNSEKNWEVESCVFDFVEPDDSNQYHQEQILITPADMETLKQQIKTVWEKIMAHDFYTGCEDKFCDTCNFVKDYNLATNLYFTQGEEETD